MQSGKSKIVKRIKTTHTQERSCKSIAVWCWIVEKLVDALLCCILFIYSLIFAHSSLITNLSLSPFRSYFPSIHTFFVPFYVFVVQYGSLVFCFPLVFSIFHPFFQSFRSVFHLVHHTSVAVDTIGDFCCCCCLFSIFSTVAKTFYPTPSLTPPSTPSIPNTLLAKQPLPLDNIIKVNFPY